MQKADGMNYAPKGKPQPVVKPGEFVFSAVRLDHGHIYGMCNGLTEAGGTIKYVYDKDPKKVEAFLKAFPTARPARSEEEALEDKETHMIAGAAVTSERCELGLKTMAAGKDYFTDKAPLTTLDQLRSAKEMVAKTGRKYMVYYSERLHVEGAIMAGYMVQHLPCDDQYTRQRGKEHKGFSEFISRPEESSQKQNVKVRKHQCAPAEINGIRVHHGVRHIGPRVSQDGHPQDGQRCHEDPCDDLDEAYEYIFRPHRVRFLHRKQHRIEDIIRLPRVLKGLEDPKTNEKAPDHDGISWDQGHQREKQEEI